MVEYDFNKSLKKTLAVTQRLYEQNVQQQLTYEGIQRNLKKLAWGLTFAIMIATPYIAYTNLTNTIQEIRKFEIEEQRKYQLDSFQNQENLETKTQVSHFTN